MLHAQIDITGMLWIAKGLDFVICVKVHKNKKMKKIVIIKIEVDMKHPAREEWEKSKDFVDTEIDDVLDPSEILPDHIRKKVDVHQVRLQRTV